MEEMGREGVVLAKVRKWERKKEEKEEEKEEEEGKLTRFLYHYYFCCLSYTLTQLCVQKYGRSVLYISHMYIEDKEDEFPRK